MAGVGASGAIFGLFGVILVATRLHHSILDAQSRAIASQIGFLIVLNLVLGFSGFFNVDNFAHLGGLATGLWLGWIFPPSQVATLASIWQSPRWGRTASVTIAARFLGVVALVVVLGIGLMIGNDKWGKFRNPSGFGFGETVPRVMSVVAVQPGLDPGLGLG